MWEILSSIWPYLVFALTAPIAVIFARFAFRIATRGNSGSISIRDGRDLANLVKGMPARSEFLEMAYDNAISDKEFIDQLASTGFPRTLKRQDLLLVVVIIR